VAKQEEETPVTLKLTKEALLALPIDTLDVELPANLQNGASP
jgi:hypothetical protein